MATAASVITEQEFLAQIVDLCHVLGYRVAHFRPAWTGRGWRTPVQGDGAGFPDLVLVGRGRVIVAELKAEKGRLSLEQSEWLEQFRAVGIPAYVWRPSDFDQIVTELQADVTDRQVVASP